MGSQDFSSGLSFVAMSRVKKITGICFKTAFGLARLHKEKETENAKQLRFENQRLQRLGFQLNTYGVDLSDYDFFD